MNSDSLPMDAKPVVPGLGVPEVGAGEPLYRTNAVASQDISAQQFRLVWEHAAAGMRLTDAHGTIVLVNEAYCRLANKRKSELLDQPFTTVYAVPERDRVMARYRENVRQGAVAESLETELALWDGRTVWLEVVSSLFSAEGQAPLVLSVFRDGTRRRQAEMEMRLHAAALQSAANAIVITDRDGRIVWVNPAFTRLTGYSPVAAIGQNPRLLKSGQQPVSVYADLWQTIAAGRVWQGEITNRRKNGTLYTEEMTITPVKNPNGAITHFIAIKQDVTTRKEMEAELQQSRQRFERIFQSNPAAIGICTLADERFLDVNESFLQLLGYAREEIIGLSAGTLGLWRDEAQYARLIAELREQGTVTNFEIRLRTKLDHTRDALASVEPIQLGGEPCLVLLLLDITERKRLEVQLRQAQKMESLGTLAGGVAHDFNNLLTVLHGHASLALMNGNLPPRAVESLRQITQAAERASNLTRQLLTFSRKQPVQLRLVNLNEVVGDLSKMLRRIIGEDITLACKYSPQIPSILADAGMVEQIVLNLAINARDAMPKGGTLFLSTTSVALAEAQARQQPGARPGVFVCLTVRDTGCGIEPALLDRVFEPFFTTKDVGKGTGLGLATVHGIVQQHQGWIEVQSQINQGTEFRIFLPSSARKKPAEFDTDLNPKPRGGRETILLVEDEPGVQGLARSILQRYGYTVLTAASGQEALKAWDEAEQKVDLLLTDVVMPGGISGRQLAARLRASKPGLRVVYTSGYSPEDTGCSLDPEATRFLPKPFPPTDLARAVRECLDQAPS